MPAPPREDPPAAADSDAEEDEDECEYLLGFVEAPRKRTDLLRHRFPSKVGWAWRAADSAAQEWSHEQLRARCCTSRRAAAAGHQNSMRCCIYACWWAATPPGSTRCTCLHRCVPVLINCCTLRCLCAGWRPPRLARPAAPAERGAADVPRHRQAARVPAAGSLHCVALCCWVDMNVQVAAFGASRSSS